MKKHQVFFKTAEIKRLNTQKKLFAEYEHTLYEKVLQEPGLLVLDIGCNNGDKTVEKFDVPNVKYVVGLEYHAVLVDSAQKEYGSDKFCFYQCNVEDAGFSDFLKTLMQRHGVAGFDIINLSLVLSHLTDPLALLGILKPFLSPKGKVVILESDDSAVELVPDTHRILPGVMQCLSHDTFAGDRSIAAKLPDLLQQTGYCDIEVIEACVSAEGSDKEKKKAIYDVFFSYIQPDMKALLAEDPQNVQYQSCELWLRENKSQIKNSICKYSEKVSIGIKLFVAHGGEYA